MGMFDTAFIPCIGCGHLVGFQSKSGECTLAEHIAPKIPLDVLPDLNRDYNTQCKNCGAYLEVEIDVTVTTRQVGRKPNKYTSVSGGPEDEG